MKRKGEGRRDFLKLGAAALGAIFFYLFVVGEIKRLELKPDSTTGK